MCNCEFVVGLDVYSTGWDLYEKPQRLSKLT